MYICCWWEYMYPSFFYLGARGRVACVSVNMSVSVSTSVSTSVSEWGGRWSKRAKLTSGMGFSISMLPRSVSFFSERTTYGRMLLGQEEARGSCSGFGGPDHVRPPRTVSHAC